MSSNETIEMRDNVSSAAAAQGYTEPRGRVNFVMLWGAIVAFGVAVAALATHEWWTLKHGIHAGLW